MRRRKKVDEIYCCGSGMVNARMDGRRDVVVRTLLRNVGTPELERHMARVPLRFYIAIYLYRFRSLLSRPIHTILITLLFAVASLCAPSAARLPCVSLFVRSISAQVDSRIDGLVVVVVLHRTRSLCMYIYTYYLFNIFINLSFLILTTSTLLDSLQSVYILKRPTKIR